MVNMSFLSFSGCIVSRAERNSNSEQATHERKKTGLFDLFNFNFPTAVYVNKCQKQIKLPNLLLTCAPYSTLPETEVKRYRKRKSFVHNLQVMVG